MLKYILGQKYAKIKQLTALVIVFTLLLNTVPLAALNNMASAETLTQSQAQAEQPQLPQQPADPVELVNERTENAKIYQNEDGTRSAKVYSQSIHYQDDFGHFQDIDNNIIDSNDSSETPAFKYQNKANRFKAFFAQKASAPNLVKVKKDNYALSFSPVNASNAEGVISENKITYSGVYDQVDLKYSVISSGVKEEIIINSYTGQNIFSFEMDTKGLEPRVESNNTISLLDNNTGELVFIIAAPFAEDANGVFSGDVTYQIHQSGTGKYVLDVVVSKAYLEDPEITYPVIVDPTTNTLSGTTQDSFIMSSYPSTNYYSTAEERVGWTSSTGIVRSYMKFTTPSLAGGIVSSASLQLYEFSGYTSSANIELHEILSSWDHTTITWNQRPIYNDVNLGTKIVDGAGQYSWDVTNLVTAWYDGRTNYGLMIKEDSENDYYRKFYASEAASNKPYILINYSLPSTPAATAVSSGVNTGTGYLNLSWAAVSGATSYGVAMYNGYQYQTFDVGNVTSWSTNTKAFYPTATDLTNGVWQFYTPPSSKSELRDDPRQLYTNAYNAHLSQVGTFSDYRNNLNYAVRTVAYRSVSIRTLNGTTDYTTPYKQESAFSAATSPTLPDSTRPPQVASVSIAGTNGTYGSDDSATVTATWTGVADSVTGTNSGTDHYKVELVKTDLKTGTVTTTSVDEPHTGTGTHSHTFTNQPDYTRNQVKVTTYDNNGNYSTTVNSATWDSADRTSPTASITAPLDSIYAKGSVTVSGTATDAIAFGNYKVEYGAGTSPSSWTQITSSTTAVSSGTLATWNTAGLNGVYTVRLTATDAAGNSSTAQKTITVDNTSPTGTITTPANNGYVNGTFNIVGTASDTNFKDYKIEYGVGSSPATWTLLNSSTTPVTSSALASWNTTALTDGLYTVRLTVTDQINNVTSTSIQVTKDATAPVAAITDPIGGKNIKGSFNVIGSATDTNFNNYVLEYASQATPAAYNSIASSTAQVSNANLGTWNTTGLGDGAYNLRLTVTDKISQTTTATVTGVVVDNTLPTGSISAPVANGYVTGTLNITGTASDTNFKDYKVEYGAGASPTTWTVVNSSTTAVSNGTLATWNTAALSDGTYTIKLTVTDKAGNVKTTTVVITKDGTVPISSITDPIAGKNIKGSFNVIGSATDTNFNNYLLEYASQAAPTTWYSIASSTTQVSNANLGTWNTTGLGDGAYNLRLTVTDKTSQTATSNVTGVVVDNTLPTGSITAPVANGYVTGTLNVTGTASDTNFKDYKVEYGAGASPTTWTVVNSSTTAVSNGTLATWNTTALSDGTYTIRLTITDKAGNVKTTTVLVTKDGTLPGASITDPIAGKNIKGSFNVIGTATDTNFKNYTLEYASQANPTVWSPITTSTTQVSNGTLGIWNTSALADGPYNLRITVTDNAYLTTTSTISGVIVDNTAPSGSISSPIVNDYAGGTYNIIGTVSDTNFKDYKVEYGAGTSPSTWTMISSGTTSKTNETLATWNASSLAEGVYSLKLTVTDKAGSVTTATVSGITVDNTLPTGSITSPADIDYLTGKVDVLGSVNDAHFTSYKVEYSLGGLYNWELIKFSTQPVTDGSLTEWDTTFLSNGFYNLRLTVNDAAGNSWTEMKTVIVDNPVALGTEDFYPTVANQVGFGTSQTNITNGNLILGFEDLHIPGRGLDLNLTRTYNSLDDSSTILGSGWRLNYEMSLTENADGSLTLIDADGSVKNFAKYEGAYLNPPGVFYDISENTVDNTYTFTDRAGTSYKFNSTGQLVRISDRNGNFLTLAYDASARLQTVTDPFNRQLTFEYLTDKVVVTDPALRKIEYTLTSGNLSNVKANYKDQSGNYVTEYASSYTYYPDGKIKEVIDPRGKKVAYGYTDNKLSSYTKDITIYSPDGNGGSIATPTSPTTTFAYDSLNRLTTVIDASGNEQEYRYNADGTLASETLYPTPTEPIVTSYTYNGNRQIISKTDGNGNLTQYSYNDLGLLTSEHRPQAKDFEGQLLSSLETRYTYGDLNNPYKPTKIEEKELLLDGVSYNEQSTRITDYSYDASGNLTTEITDQSGINFITSYEYLNGNLQNKQVHKDSAEIITTTYLYDSNNLYLSSTEVVSSLEPTNKLEKLSYEYEFTTGDKKASIDNFGIRTEYDYSGFGRLQSETVSSSTTLYEYDAVGNQTKVTRPSNRETNYSYDEDNHLISSENPIVTVYDYGADDGSAPTVTSGSIRTYSFFDQLGNEVAIMDGRGKVTNKEYDGIGRLIETTDPLQNKLVYGYDQNNNQISSTKYTSDGVGGYTNQGTTTYRYDENNRLIGETDPVTGEFIKRYYYDVFGNQTKSVDAVGNILYQDYDKQNRMYHQQDSSDPNTEVTFGYDHLGNKTSETTINGTASYQYDGLNRLIKVTDAKNNITQYLYSTSVNQKIQVDANGGTTEYYYDALGRVYQEKQTLDGITLKSTIDYLYNPDGTLQQEVLSETGKSPVTTNYTYDETGRMLTEVASKDGVSVENKYMYDANGNVEKSWIKDWSKLTDGQPYKNKMVYTYDDLNRVLTETSTNPDIPNSTKTTTYNYNDDSRTITLGSAGTFFYDQGGKLTQITNGTENYYYQYYSNNTLEEFRSIGAYTTYTYNNDKIATLTVAKKSDGIPLIDLNYQYNSNNQLLSILENGTLVKSYTYTEAGQVATANGTSYSYDANGNMTGFNSDTGQRKEYVFNNADQLTVQQVYQDNALTKEFSYSYDANGNLITAQETDYSVTPNRVYLTEYQYNAGNQLIKVSQKEDGNLIQEISYEYDANGARTKKIVGETVYTYYYENGSIAKEEIVSGTTTTTLTYQTDDKGGLVGLSVDGTPYYYQFNNRGDVIALTDASGQIVVKYNYDTWGNMSILSDTTPNHVGTLNPYTYVGKFAVRYDKDTGMYLMTWRDYDPSTGRFIIPDTYFGEEDKPFSQNRYLYAEGDPVNNVDPSGHMAIWAALAIASAGASMAVYLYEHRNGGFQWTALATSGTRGALTGLLLEGAGQAAGKAVTWGYNAVARQTVVQFSGGKAGEQYLAKLVGGKSQVYFRTSRGGRYIDQLANGVAHESKVGYTTLTESVRSQVLKDAELIKQGKIEGATWHFFRSADTGKIGASQPLLDFLRANGIKYVIHY